MCIKRKILTSGIPIHDYQVDRLVVFSANARYSESEKHAEKRNAITLAIKRVFAVLISRSQTYVAYAPSYRTLLARGRRLICLTLDAEIHNVITTDGTIVHNNV